MQREERISRQWPPSEIAMENGNTMIPPVAIHNTGQTRRAMGGHCNFNYTKAGLSQSLRQSDTVLLQSEERELLLTILETLQHWQAGKRFSPGIW